MGRKIVRTKRKARQENVGGGWGGCTHLPPHQSGKYSSYLGLLGGKVGAGPGEEAGLHQPQSDRLVPGADCRKEGDKD